MAITLDEVLALGERWCDTLRREDGGGIAERKAMFFHPEPRIYVQHQGLSMTLEEHGAYHTQFRRQVLRLGDFVVTPLGEAPDRARAIGTFYWEGHFKDEKQPPLRCVVGEDWLVQRDADGVVKYVLWLNTIHHFLADSSVQKIEL